MKNLLLSTILACSIINTGLATTKKTDDSVPVFIIDYTTKPPTILFQKNENPTLNGQEGIACTFETKNGIDNYKILGTSNVEMCKLLEEYLNKVDQAQKDIENKDIEKEDLNTKSNNFDGFYNNLYRYTLLLIEEYKKLKKQECTELERLLITVER